MNKKFAGYKAMIILGRKKLYSKKTYRTVQEALKESDKKTTKLIKLPLTQKKRLFGKIKTITTGYKSLY